MKYILEQIVIKILVDMKKEEQVDISDRSKYIDDLEGADSIPTKRSGFQLKAPWNPSPFSFISGLWLNFEGWRNEESMVPVGFPVPDSPYGLPATNENSLLCGWVKVKGLGASIILTIN